MASKIKDITKTGPIGLRGIRGTDLYSKLQAGAANNDKDALAILQGLSNTKPTPYNFGNPEQYFRPIEQVAGSPFEDLGNSSYDDSFVMGEDASIIGDIRAERQPWYAKLGAGAGKALGLAATTFLDGTIGLLVGGGEAIVQGDFSRLWDNEISNGLASFNKSMEEWLPNYKTEEEQNRSWYENLGTINFWADGFFKNMGFAVGALYSGGVFTKGLKYAGKGIQYLGEGMQYANVASKAAKVSTKVGSKVGSLGVAMQTNGLGAKLTGSLFSAVNEGRIEANHTTSDLRDLRIQEASDAHAKRRQEILDDGSLNEEERIALLAEVDGNYDVVLDKIDEDLKKAGATDLLLNVPILAASNFWTFGRMYAQGFSNAKTVAGKDIKKSFLSRASQAANEAANAAENTLIKNTTKEAGKYAWNEITKKQALGKGLLTGLIEGNEEMAQAWASEFAGNNAFYSDTPDTYYRAMSNPKALQETMDAWEAASKAFANTYGNGDRYEEFAIGALTGLLGIPTFGKSQNSGANTWVGRGKSIGISGGIMGELRSSAEMNKMGYAHVTSMNKALEKREQIEKTARVKAAMSQFNDAMNGFAEDDDKFEYHNASDNLDWMGITSFISTGREADLKEILGQDFDNISDEELASIAAFTAQNDNSDTGGFRERGSGKLITVDSSQSDKDEMRQKLNKSKEKMLDEIDAYKNSVDIIRNYAAGDPRITEEKINELAWMHWKTNRFDRRAGEIKEDDAELFTIIALALEDFKVEQRKILYAEEESTEGLTPAAMSVAENKNTNLFKAKQSAKKNLEYAEELIGVIMSVANNNKKLLPFLAPMLKMDKDFLKSVLKSDNFYDLAIGQGLSKPEFDKAIRDIIDLGRLAEVNVTFQNKLKEYMEDPFKQDKDHEEIDSENEAVAQEVNKEINRKKAKKVTRQQILNGDVNADDVIANTNNSDIEKQMAQDAKITDQVSKRLESIIANRNHQGIMSDEDAVIVQSAIHNGIAQSQSVNDLMGGNAAFMVDANGQPLSDEQISLIQDLLETATREVAEANGITIKDGKIDFSKVEENIPQQVGPTGAEAGEVEEVLEKEKIKNTGNDAVEQAVAVNDKGVTGNPEEAIKKGRANRGSSKNNKKRGKKGKGITLKTKKEQKAPTRFAAEQAKKENEDNKKNSIVSASLLFAINGNAITINTPKGKQASEYLSNILSRAYDIINEGEIKKLSRVMEVLKSMDEFEKLQQLLGKDPNLMAALTNINTNLEKEFIPEEDDIDDAAKLEKLIGPETINDVSASPTSFSSQTLNPQINIPNYFAPATSQYYRDPKTGQIIPEPFTKKITVSNKARKKKLEATYNYLNKNEAFKNASKVRGGDTIYFTIHPSLNTEVGGVVILMSTDPEGKHIVGDLADTESATYKDNSLLRSTINRITEEFNNREDKDSSEPFVSKETSSVRQAMVGHVLFTDSKNKAGDKTLNSVFGNGSFKMGVTNRAGKIITTNQGDESVSGNLDIVTPKTRFAPGTPVVLIPSGEGTNKYIAVPFQMSKYDSSMKGTKFHKYAEAILRRVLLNNNGEPIDLSSNKAQVLVKNALNALFNGEFHVNFTNNQLVIHRTIRTVKDGVTEKKNDVLFRGVPNSSIVTNILNALQSKGMIIRIDRREINRESNLKDLDFSYNTMMGDLAHTNLSDKSSSTVNDWFIVNPINEKGEEISTKRVEYRDTRTGKTPTQRNDTKITYKNNDYLVSEEDAIVDKDGNPRTDINVSDQQIILAKAEIEKNDLITPIGTEGEQIFWYSLSNGNLFYNKDGEERVVVSEEDKQAVKNSLIKKDTPPNQTFSGPIKNVSEITIDSIQEGRVFKNFPEKVTNVIYSIDNKFPTIIFNWKGNSYMLSYSHDTWSLGERNDKGTYYSVEFNIKEERENTVQTALNTFMPKDIAEWSDLSIQGQDKLTKLLLDKYGVPLFSHEYVDNDGKVQYPLSIRNEGIKDVDGLKNYLSSSGQHNEELLENNELKKETLPEETAESKYPKGFNSQDQKNFFDAMLKERQQQLMDANPNAIAAILPHINSIIKDFGIDSLDDAKDDIDNIFEDLSNTKYRTIEESEEYSKIDIEAEKEWLKKALPQLSDDDHFKIIEGLIKISRKNDPGYAYGKTQQGIITISDAAATGTVYHEAFHSVIDVLLSGSEIDKLFIAGAKRYGIERGSIDNDLTIEEHLAEDFRRYVQREQSYEKDLEQSSGISKIFKILKHTVKTWLDNISYINNMFYRINKGKLANREIQKNRNTERFSMYTEEERAILDKASRNAQGQLLAPNGKVSNLTEKQYAQVRTKAFIEWFGDWINDPENASKVVDENGEPLVVYHGTPHNSITEFKHRKDLGLDTGGRGTGEEGFYFTSKKSYAERYKASHLMYDTNTKNGEVMEVFLNVRNLTTFDSKNFPHSPITLFYKMSSQDRVKLESEGIDGLMLGNLLNNSQNKRPEIVVLNPNQIKSATDNVGTFSTTNNDIRYREADITLEDIHKYHREKLDYVNLEDSQKYLLEDRGITEEQYSFLTLAEKENLRMCLI